MCVPEGRIKPGNEFIYYILDAINDAIGSVGDAFEKIDAKFGYGTTSQVMGGIGIGSGMGTALGGLGGRIPNEKK